MTRRYLSSAQTWLMKFAGPSLFYVGAVLFAALLYVSPLQGLYRQIFVRPLGYHAQIVFWCLWGASTLFWSFWGFALKRVAIDDEALYISDYDQEVAVTFDAIAEVREFRWIQLHPVTIVLRSPTPWGYTIRFMPKIRMFVPGLISHPVVAELRELAFAAEAARRARPMDFMPESSVRHFGRGLDRCRVWQQPIPQIRSETRPGARNLSRRPASRLVAEPREHR